MWHGESGAPIQSLPTLPQQCPPYRASAGAIQRWPGAIQRSCISHSPLTPGSPPTGNLPQRGHGCRTLKHKGGTHTLWFLATVNSPQICVCHTMELRSLWVIFRVAPFAGRTRIHRPRYHVPGPGLPCFYIALRPGGPCSCNGSPRPVLANGIERRTVSSRQFSSYSTCRRHGVTLVGFASPEPERVVCVKRVRASPADAVLPIRRISTVASWAGCFLRAEQSGAFRLRREQSSSVPVLRPFVCLHDRVTRQIRNSDSVLSQIRLRHPCC